MKKLKKKFPIFNKSIKRKPQYKRKIGQSPGTLIFVGEKKTENIVKELISFDDATYIRQTKNTVQELMQDFSAERTNWFNIEGLHDTAVIDNIGKLFNLHPLLLEDVLNIEQRPKSEDFGNYIFFTIKSFKSFTDQVIEYEHFSFVFGKDFLISFQEKPEDTFNNIRERLETSQGKLRLRKSDYLFYRLIDTIVDNYYLVLDHIADKIEELEEEVLVNPDTESLHKLQGIKKEMIYLRRSIYPVREAINSLTKRENDLITDETQRYLTDVYDHTIHIIESMETYRDLLNGIMDIYMNSVSNKLNEVMKVLTIISTIFIPLTFIAGIYGMNFEYMPELGWKYGYPLTWTVMIAIIIFMLFYFRRKKWL